MFLNATTPRFGANFVIQNAGTAFSRDVQAGFNTIMKTPLGHLLVTDYPGVTITCQLQPTGIAMYAALPHKPNTPPSRSVWLSANELVTVNEDYHKGRSAKYGTIGKLATLYNDVGNLDRLSQTQQAIQSAAPFTLNQPVVTEWVC